MTLELSEFSRCGVCVCACQQASHVYSHLENLHVYVWMNEGVSESAEPQHLQIKQTVHV